MKTKTAKTKTKKRNKKLFPVIALILLVLVVGVTFTKAYLQRIASEKALRDSEKDLESYALLQDRQYIVAVTDPVTGKRTMNFEGLAVTIPSGWFVSRSSNFMMITPDGVRNHIINASILPINDTSLIEELTETKKQLNFRGAGITKEEFIHKEDLSINVYWPEVFDPQKFYTPNSGSLPYKEALVSTGKRLYTIAVIPKKYSKEFDDIINSLSIAENIQKDRFAIINYESCTTDTAHYLSETGVTEIRMVGLKESYKTGRSCVIDVSYKPYNLDQPVEFLQCEVPTSWRDHEYQLTDKVINFSVFAYHSICTFRKAMNSN